MAKTTGINVSADELLDLVDIDGTLAANSDVVVPSQKAVRTYGAATFTKAPVAAPLAANSAGVAGTWAYDATHIYVCVAANTWVRAVLAAW
jgi:hypothetical protein